MANLEPLEFKECVVDSPFFREKLRSHEKEIKKNVKNFKSIVCNIEKVYGILESCSAAFEELSDSLIKFSSNDDQNVTEMYKLKEETEDEKRIRCSVKLFSDVINNLEAMRRKHILGPSKALVMVELQQLGDDCLSRSEQNIKEFKKSTTAYYTKLEKYSGIKYKQDCENDSIDTEFQEDRRQFVKKALEHVMLLEETEEKKTTQLAHTLGLMIQMFKTYYHEAFDHIEDLVKKVGEIDVYVDRTMESYTSITVDTKRLMRKIMNDPIELIQPDSETNGEVRREGYLFVLTKKQLVPDTWVRKYCIYAKNSKKLQLIQTTQTGLNNSMKMQNEDYEVISCEGKLLNNAERRFCFELKVSNQSTPLTLQALSKEDLKQWLLIMDGKEPHYGKQLKSDAQELKSPLNDKAMKLMSMCFTELEKRGFDFVGLYRQCGSKSERDVLVQKMISHASNQFRDSLSAKDLESVEITALTSAVKDFIKRFKVPLATFDLYDKFISAGKLPTSEERYNALLPVVKELPQEHYQILSLVLKHLNRVSLHEKQNLMPAANLAVCFSPTILQSKDENTSLASIKESKFGTEALTVMIERWDELFSASDQYSSNTSVKISKSMKITKDEMGERKNTVERSNTLAAGYSTVKKREPLTKKMSDSSPLLSDKGLSLEESISLVRGLMDQFKSLASLNDLKSLSEVCKKLSQLFFECPNYQVEHADTFLELGLPELAVRSMKKLNNMGILKSDEIWFTSFYCYEMCRRYSNVSFDFASALCLQGLSSLLIVNIGHKAYLEKLSSDSINFLIKASLDIIRNMCRYPGNCTYFRSDAVNESLRTLTKVDKGEIRVVATLCLVLIVSESDTYPDSGGEDFLRNIVKYVREARASDRKKIMGYRSYDLLQGIRSTTSVERERQHFIDIDGLGLLKEIFEDRRNATNEELLECLEILCNISNSEELIGKLLKTGFTSSIIQSFTTHDNVFVKSAAQDYLWRLEMNETVYSEIVSMDPVYQSTVYLCHSSINKQIVLKLQGRLQETGRVKIIDSENRFNVASVKKTIQKCAIVILCLSEAFKSQPRYQLEVDYCDRLSKHVIPVLIQQKYRPDGWLQKVLDRGVPWFNLSSKVDFDSSWETLIGLITNQLDDIKKYLKNRAPNEGDSEPIKGVLTMDKSSVWLERNGLHHLKVRLDWLDMSLLKSFQLMKSHASEYFYQTLERHLKLDIIDILKFSTAIEDL